MLERKLVAAAIKSRAAYDTIRETGALAEPDELVRPIWEAVEEYYARDDAAADVDSVVLSDLVTKGFANPKKAREYAELVASVAGESVSLPNIRELCRANARDRAGLALASALAGRKSPDEVVELLQRYTELAQPVDDTGDTDGSERIGGWGDVLRERLAGDNRLPVSPRVLNPYIAGGVAPGHNVTIFGRPESGKTALAITMACGFARRGKRVLYIGNEDPVRDLMVRIITNLTGKSVDELAPDPDAAEREALAKGAGNIVVKSTHPGTIPEIEALIKHHKPDVLFVDQLRNITSGKTDNFTQLLDKNAQAVRALGKKYGLVTVSVTQAGDSATNRPVLGMGDVDSSNTGIPGAADLMIGVGVTDALDKAGQRMLSLCKNKLGAVHPAVPVTLDPFRSKMK